MYIIFHHVVETKISIPEQLRLRSFDLNVLLGNLLDNAIDASVQTEDKKLKITIKLDKGILFLNICNSCQRIADGRRDFLETTKEDKGNHGIGLKNVRRIVKKYHGDLAFLYENGSMETDVMISFLCAKTCSAKMWFFISCLKARTRF